MDRLTIQQNRLNPKFDKTYFDIKYANSSKIFESEEIIRTQATPAEIHEAEQLYYDAVDRLEKGEELDEGFFGGLIGGTLGALAGPAIGRALCKVLGIDEKGHFGKLLTSRLVTTAMGIALGK
jgi:hypothetical protein